MSTPAQRGVRPVALPLFPILIILAIGVLLGASLRAGAAPYAAMVMDARTGEVLHSRNADARLHPASLTKMMTLYIAFEAVEAGEIGLDDKVTVSRKAASEVPSKLGLRAGQKIELRYLIRAAAVKSANDAATAIGEAISGSEAAFARRMTRTARALGMTRTTFKNAHGLTEQGHLSTARDMTILGRRLFYDYPEYYNLFSRRSTSAKIATVNNTNRRFLGAYKGADGIKTGYTRAAGFNLVASAERGGERIITTVFGGTSTAARNAEVARLMDIGFKRAPRYAKVVRPAPPNYAGLPDARGHVVSAVRAVKRSVRPAPRPGQSDAAPVDVLMAAMESEIAEALEAAAGVAGPEGSAPDVLESAAANDVLKDGVARDGEEAGEAVAAAGAEAALPAPQAPGDAAATDAEPVQIAAAGAAAPQVTALPGVTRAAAAAARAIAPRSVSFLRSSPTPEPRPDADAEATTDVAALTAPPLRSDGEVISRASTSGGRHWAISLGRYPTRYAAEKVLLKTALSEMATLDGALRKVSQDNRGFNANFVGLSEDQAERACRRLVAQGSTCETMAPGRG